MTDDHKSNLSLLYHSIFISILHYDDDYTVLCPKAMLIWLKTASRRVAIPHQCITPLANNIVQTHCNQLPAKRWTKYKQ